MKQLRPSFARHLLGSSRSNRPPFFVSYFGFWIHLFISIVLWYKTTATGNAYFFALIIVGSFAFSLIVYGSKSNQHIYFVNIISYMIVVIELLNGPKLGRPISLAALILITTSLHFVLQEQLRTFPKSDGSRREHLPKWPGQLCAFLVALIFIISIGFHYLISGS